MKTILLRHSVSRVCDYTALTTQHPILILSFYNPVESGNHNLNTYQVSQLLEIVLLRVFLLFVPDS